MAQKTLVQMVDDIDGSEAEETVPFGLDGTVYEIDLSGEHANALREALAPYIVAARKAGGSEGNGRRGGARRGSGDSSSPSGSDRQRTQAIREWAGSRAWRSTTAAGSRAGSCRPTKRSH